MIDIIHVAKACHEANKVYCESLGDFTQEHWENAPQWQKDSAVSGVKHIIDNPDVTAEQMHDNWMAEKKADGWRFGITKDAFAKTHPCLIPYNFLPIEQRMKDTLFISIARSFYNEANR